MALPFLTERPYKLLINSGINWPTLKLRRLHHSRAVCLSLNAVKGLTSLRDSFLSLPRCCFNKKKKLTAIVRRVGFVADCRALYETVRR